MSGDDGITVGLDLGTSGVRAIAVDASGTVLAARSERFDFDRPRSGWAETPPERWWGASERVLRALTSSGVDASRVAALGLSGQMHGAVLLDEAAVPAAASAPISALCPALMWNDQRTEVCLPAIERALGGRSACVRRTGCPPLTGLTAPKLCWVQEHEPEIARRVAAWCLPKDFIALGLTGTLATDVGDASGTLLLDPRTRDWSVEAIAALGLEGWRTPTVYESATVTGTVTEWAAASTGLAPGTPVVIGSGDNQVAAVGAGVTSPGDVLAVLGTSGVVLAPLAEPATDHEHEPCGRVNLFCDATGSATNPGAWLASGCMLSAAGSLEWARSVLGLDVSFDALIGEAADAPAGSDGLLFLPYLTGERCPVPDPGARGAWVGLTRSHTRGHLIRAVLEGVAFNLAAILDVIRATGAEPEAVRVTGGGATSRVWCEILATAFGTPVVPLAIEEGPAYGAATCAAAAISGHPVAEIARARTCLADPIAPNERAAAALANARAAFDRLHADLAPVTGLLNTAASASSSVSNQSPSQ